MLKQIDKTYKLPYIILLLGISVFTLISTINLELIYHLEQPLFLIDFKTFSNSLLTPGGLINYIATFFTTLYYYSKLGAILLTAILPILPIITYKRLIKTHKGLFSVIVGSIIGLISLLLFVNYSFKLSNLLTLIGAVAFANLIIFIYKKLQNIFALLALLISLLLGCYLFLGGFGLLLTSSLLVLRFTFLETILTKKLIAIIPILLIAIFLPYLSVKLIYQLVPMQSAYFNNFTNNLNYTNPHLLYVLVSLIVLIEIIPLFKSKSTNASANWSYWVSHLIFVSLLLILPFILINKTEKKKLLIDYYATNKQWDKLLNELDKEVLKDYTVVFQANRALYFTGGILNNAFKAPQVFGAKALLIEHSVNKAILMPTSDVYFDLGFINESRHWAHEAFTSHGMQPRILKRLVEVNIINEKYNTAKKFILTLKKSLVYRKWAAEQEKLLNNEALINGNEVYHAKKLENIQNDFFANSKEPVSNLLNLIHEDNIHKMAFEYLITYYLLQHDVIHVVKLIPDFKNYNYKTLPILVQEAIIIYMAKTNTNNLDLYGYQVDSKQIVRFNEYSKLYTLYLNRDKSAQAKLDAEFSDTYYYYIHFTSPITKSGKK